MSPLLAWSSLAGAIVCEIIGTVYLGKSVHFTRLVPCLLCVLFYAASVYLLAQSLRVVPLALAYASWGGLGIIFTTVASILIFKQRPDTPALIGITLIVIGVVIVNGFSKMSVH